MITPDYYIERDADAWVIVQYDGQRYTTGSVRYTMLADAQDALFHLMFAR